jgi:hypothetical protein
LSASKASVYTHQEKLQIDIEVQQSQIPPYLPILISYYQGCGSKSGLDPDPVARNNSYRYIAGTKEAEASHHTVNFAR